MHGAEGAEPAAERDGARRTEALPAGAVSIVIPCYNEEATIAEILRRVQAVEIGAREVIVVDDGSTDGTRALLQGELAALHDRLILRPRNGGKGAALVEGFAAARGDLVVVQDADLEYHPDDYPALLEPLRRHGADVVYGSRFVASNSHRVLYYWHSLANRWLTLFSNMMTNLNLTDMATGAKAFRREALQGLRLKERGFGIEPELTARLAQRRLVFYEVGVSYHGRTYAEGKKIGWRDAFRYLWVILRCRLTRG